MIARRLLIAGGGGGGIAAPAPPATLTGAEFVSPGGLWNGASDQVACTYNGKTYFAWPDDSHNLYIASYDHATGTVAGPTLVGSGTVSSSGDIHNAISVLVRSSDHRICIAFCNEEGDHFIWNVSTNPEDITSFGSPVSILSGGNYTYVSLNELTGEGAIYLWTSSKVSSTFYGAYSKSTDGGSTWSAMQSVISPVATDRTYRRVGSNQTDRLDIFTTSTDRTDANPSSVHHFYATGGNLYQSDGTLVGSLTGGPYVASAGTLVQGTGNGSARPEGWSYDGSGRPATIIGAYDAGTTHIIGAQWNGSSWQTNAVTDTTALRNLAAAISKSDPTDAYVAVVVSGREEVWRYQYSGGAWAGVAITSGSSVDNIGVDTPINASDVKALWGHGTYTSDSDFAFDIWGAT